MAAKSTAWDYLRRSYQQGNINVHVGPIGDVQLNVK